MDGLILAIGPADGCSVDSVEDGISLVETRGSSCEHPATELPLGISYDGKRGSRLERPGSARASSTRTGHVNATTASGREALLHQKVEQMLKPELQHREIVPEGGSCATLIDWVEVGGTNA